MNHVNATFLILVWALFLRFYLFQKLRLRIVFYVLRMWNIGGFGFGSGWKKTASEESGKTESFIITTTGRMISCDRSNCHHREVIETVSVNRHRLKFVVYALFFWVMQNADVRGPLTSVDSSEFWPIYRTVHVSRFHCNWIVCIRVWVSFKVDTHAHPSHRSIVTLSGILFGVYPRFFDVSTV